MDQQPLVSFVIVTHGRKDLVLRAVKSCFEQDYANLEVIVVLNPRDPETEAMLKREYPRTKVISTHKNLGFYPALNIGLANGDGAHFFVLDDDAYFLQKDALGKFVDAMEGEPELGIVTCDIEGPSELPPLGDEMYVGTFKSGFALYRREVFTEWVGYYPDAFFRSGGENYQLGRLWNIGKRVKSLKGVLIYHDQALKGRSKRDWNFYGIRSQVLCCMMRDPLRVLPLRLLSKLITSFRHFAILNGAPGVWLTAWVHVFFYTPYALGLRKGMSWKTYLMLRKLEKEPSKLPPEVS